ncbi:hypothetical protein C8R47DRAFT_1129684 [Mycena vitilis]|nr:hypothetical protein C8R47DRAFT_1129684 [Mycena vitilis]
MTLVAEGACSLTTLWIRAFNVFLAAHQGYAFAWGAGLGAAILLARWRSESELLVRRRGEAIEFKHKLSQFAATIHDRIEHRESELAFDEELDRRLEELSRRLERAGDLGSFLAEWKKEQENENEKEEKEKERDQKEE